MTDQHVRDLIEEFHVPKHVRRHCAAVANFALELAEKLVKVGENIDIELVRRAALLHDLVRVVDFREFNPETFPDPVTAEEVAFWKKLREKYAGLHHAEAGARILEEKGFKEEAQIVRTHRFLQIAEGFDTWEEKLVYYADKRVKHAQVVPLQERLDDGRKRNAPETIGGRSARELDEKIFMLEREILMPLQQAH